MTFDLHPRSTRRLVYRAVSFVLAHALVLTSLPMPASAATVDAPMEAVASPAEAQVAPVPPVPPAMPALPSPPPGKVNRTAPKVTPPPMYPVFSAEPSVQEIFRARVFGEPLFPVGGEPSLAQNLTLVAAINDYLAKGAMENTEPLEDFLAANPDSPWRMTLLANIGVVYARTHRYTRADKALGEAWELGRDDTSENGRALADMAMSERLQLEMNFGRVERLEDLLAQIGNREMLGSAAEYTTYAHWSVWGLRNRHQDAVPSGPVALDQILRHLGAKAADDDAPLAGEDSEKEGDNPAPTVFVKNRKLAAVHASPDGVSLAQMAKLASEVGLPMRAAFREPGGEIVVPSMMHFSQGHFAAVLDRTNTHVRLADPIFGGEIWMSLKAFEEESSGYFLVREHAAPKGWRDALPSEAEGHRGKCHYPFADPEATKPGNRFWGWRDEYLVTGEEPGEQNPGPPNNEDPTGSEPEPECDACPCTGMPTASFHTMKAGISISDIPLSYRAPVGPRVSFQVAYSQLEATQPAVFTTSNLGRRWSHSWMSYVEDDPSNPASVKVAIRGGGRETYTGFDGSAYAPHWESRATVVRTSSSPVRYERRLASGSVEVFAQTDGALASPRRIYITEYRTPQGNKMDLAYDGQLRLTSVTDSIGQVTTLSYDLLSDPLKITKVTDPFGRSAVLQYDTAGKLSRITDTAGLSSSLEYGAPDFVRALTTPYGTTTFRYGVQVTTLGYEPRRWAEATDPMGAVRRVEFVQNASSQPNSEPAPTGFRGINLNQRTSYYWGPRNNAGSAELPDYSHATAMQWGFLDTFRIGAANLSVKLIGRSRVYSNHASATSSAALNPHGRPDAVGRVLVDATFRIQRYERSPIGRVTRHTDPIGRETVYEYDTNGLDLLRLKRVNPAGVGGYDLLATFTYNAVHRPLTYVDASGRTWTFTYNAKQQIATVTTPPRAGISENRTTTYSYDPVTSYLASVTGPATGATVAYTYDSRGRVRTVTDPDSYTITLDYDDLNRPTRVTYPDATYEETQYDRLWASAFRDRRGRVSQVFRDARGLITGTRDAQGRTTVQQRCLCGSLDKLTDARGNTTEWQRNDLGQVIKEVRANGATTDVTYDPNTGWTKEVKDSLSQVASYEYFADGALKRLFYQNALKPTPAASFTYDPLYRRVATMTDGLGTTSYSYNPVSATQLGAGRLASLDGPYATDTLAYTYDELGRAATRTYGGTTTTWGRDVLGRLTSQAESIGSFTFGYVGVTGRLQQLTYPNNQTSSYAYFPNSGDKRLQEIHHRVAAAGATLSRFNYTYDVLGNVATWQQQHDTDTKLWEYGYDMADQLVSAVQKTTGGSPSVVQRFSYGYDPAGNRTALQGDDAATSATFDVMNRLLSTQAGGALKVRGTLNEPATVTVQGQPGLVAPDNSFQGSTSIGTGSTNVTVQARDGNGNLRTNVYQVSASGGTTNYSYDANGNLTGDGTKTLEWDAANRLVAVKQGGSTLATFTYDGFGRRAQKVAGGVTRTYLYEGIDIIEERPSSGSTIRFIHGPGIDQPLAKLEGGITNYYLADHLGSIVQVTSSAAAIMLTRKYDPWGNMASGGTTSGYAFTGREWDTETGLYYYRARYYDAKVGRFIGEDPIGLAGGDVNFYGYAWNRPTQYVDPLGTTGLETAGAVGGYQVAQGILAGEALGGGAAAASTAAGGTAASVALPVTLALAAGIIVGTIIDQTIIKPVFWPELDATGKSERNWEKGGWDDPYGDKSIDELRKIERDIRNRTPQERERARRIRKQKQKWEKPDKKALEETPCE